MCERGVWLGAAWLCLAAVYCCLLCTSFVDFSMSVCIDLERPDIEAPPSSSPSSSPASSMSVFVTPVTTRSVAMMPSMTGHIVNTSITNSSTLQREREWAQT